MSAADDGPLLEVLAQAQALGMLGDRPPVDVVTHARSFVAALRDVRGTVVDLGSGGGVPGLVIAWDRPDLTVVLVDRRARRTDQLHRAARRLGMDGRVTVRATDVAELVRAARAGAERFDAATARGLGPPERTARAALALVRPGAPVVISEPPEGTHWTLERIDRLGVTVAREGAVAVLRARSG
jgi:16S rRNA (guanine527-N7)-methyltransferase